LIRAALYGLKKIYRPGFASTKAEVILIGIVVSRALPLIQHDGASERSDG
jgi:hypothetical protein